MDEAAFKKENPNHNSEESSSSTLQRQEGSTSNKNNSDNKFFIMSKYYTLADVREHAHKPFSDETMEINRKRIDQSNLLMDKLKSQECQNFLESILTGAYDCKRHKTYVKGDVVTRREMKFSSPGPLIVGHQEELAKMLFELSKKFYPHKPANLKDYEYDILYPEVSGFLLRFYFKKKLKKY